MTKWKTKFFYFKVAASTAKLQFRNVTGTIITENISVPKADTVDWFPRLRIIGWVKLDNRQLWVLQMMLDKMTRNARPVVREKSSEDSPMGRMFCLDFEGEVEIVACADGEKGFNRTIRDNFQLPERVALEAVLPQGKGDLGALGDPAATGVPKQAELKISDKRACNKNTHEVVVIPPLVLEVAGISCTQLRKYDDYVVVSDTLEGLGVLGGSAAAGGSSAGTKPVHDKKRKGDAPAAGGQKAPKLRKTQVTAIPKSKPAVTTGKLIVSYTSVVVLVVTNRCALFYVETQEETVSLFATPPYSPKVVDVEVQKEGRRSPFIEVVSGGGTLPYVHAGETAGETIADTLDLSNKYIDPHDADGQRARSRSPLLLKSHLVLLARAQGAGFGLPPPPWNVMQGDDVSNDPSACREILGGLGSPFEVVWARGLPRQNRINQLSSMLVGSSLVANAIMEDYNVLGRREEQTIRLKAEAEAMTETWAASAGLKQVRSLTKLLFDERKGWREVCARGNEKMFRVRQELTNLKAANAALMKEKVAAEAAAKEAETRGATALKEAEARASKALEEADTDRTKLNKVVEELKV
ncbi:hypothetical protein Hanom_Chr12g01101281 [Helianthus anomalus]